MKIPNARLLNKEEFVSVCLDATKRFLHDRRRASPRAGGGGGSSTTSSPRIGSGGGVNTFGSPREEYMLVKLLEAEVDRRVGAFASAGYRAVASRIPHDDDDGTSPIATMDEAAPSEGEIYAAPPPLSPRVVKELSFRHLNNNNTNSSRNQEPFLRYDEEQQQHSRPLASSNSAATPYGRRLHNNNNHGRGGEANKHSTSAATPPSSSTTVLHPIQVSAVQFVKRILDPVYCKGMMTKQEYTDAVLSITAEGFSLAQRRALDLAPRSVNAEFNNDDNDDEHESTAAALGTLSSEFAGVLQEIADSVSFHYTSRFDAAREAADAVAHEALRTTHAVSVRPHHRHRSSSRSPSSQKASDAVVTTHGQHVQRLHDGGEATKTAAIRHAANSSTSSSHANHSKRRSGSLGAASTNSSNHRIGVDEDEAAFDAQVEHIRNLLAGSLGSGAAVRESGLSTTTADKPLTTTETSNKEDSEELSPSSMRRRRKQVLESELKLLTVEMNTLAQRAYKVRDELASI